MHEMGRFPQACDADLVMRSKRSARGAIWAGPSQDFLGFRVRSRRRSGFGGWTQASGRDVKPGIRLVASPRRPLRHPPKAGTPREGAKKGLSDSRRRGWPDSRGEADRSSGDSCGTAPSARAPESREKPSSRPRPPGRSFARHRWDFPLPWRCSTTARWWRRRSGSARPGGSDAASDARSAPGGEPSTLQATEASSVTDRRRKTGAGPRTHVSKPRIGSPRHLLWWKRWVTRQAMAALSS